MPFNNLFGSRILGELAQYPDQKLYKAAGLLTEDERPKNPVRLMDPDPKKNYLFKLRPHTAGLADYRTNNIYITDRQSEDNNDPRWLAGLMGHEAEHFKRQDKEGQEKEAYAKQLAILDRLKYQGPNLNALKQSARGR